MLPTKKRLKEFIINHPHASRQLREVLLGYIAAQTDTGLPVDFRQWLWTFNDLFDLLEEISDAQRDIN